MYVNKETKHQQHVRTRRILPCVVPSNCSYNIVLIGAPLVAKAPITTPSSPCSPASIMAGTALMHYHVPKFLELVSRHNKLGVGHSLRTTNGYPSGIAALTKTLHLHPMAVERRGLSGSLPRHLEEPEGNRSVARTTYGLA